MLTGVLLANIGYALVQPIERDELPVAVPDHAGRSHQAQARRSGSCAPTSRRASPCTPLGDYAAKVAQVQARGRPRHGQPLRPRAARRLPARVRGRRRQRGAEDLGAAQRHGLRAVPRPGRRATSTRSCRCSWPARPCASPSSTARVGLKDKLPLIGTGVYIDESALRSMGDEAIGTVGALHLGAHADRRRPTRRS